MITFLPRFRRSPLPVGTAQSVRDALAESRHDVRGGALALLGEVLALPSTRARNSLEWSPIVDVIDGPTHVTVRAELPGLHKSDVLVEVADGQLMLRGEKKAVKLSDNDKWWCSESSHGAFARVLDLPSAVEAEKADAKITDGVLTIRLPKLAQSAVQRPHVA